MIKRIKKILEQYGLHTFLLPVFFVLHNYLQYYGLVSAGAVLGTGTVIELIFAAFFLLLLLITRHAGRSLQITTLLGFIALFYGVIKDFFNGTAGLHFMAKYSVLLPLLIVLSIAAIMVIRKKKDFRKANLFQNGLLLLFILLDSVLLLRSGAGFFMQQNRLVKNNLLNPDTLAIPARRPDVYFLVFDSYPGTGFLHDNVQFDNTPFDSILQKKGFYVVARPKSNYSRTAFSIAATLNFEYLQNIPAGKKPEPKHYSQASLSIERSAVTTVFTHLGYHIYNLSFFDFTGYPALKRENFMVLPEKRMLLYNTLGERFRRDVLWHFPFLKYGIHVRENEKILFEDDFFESNTQKRDFNNEAVNTLLNISRLKTDSPKFIYAHLYLPHPPFFYDSSGRSIPMDPAAMIKSMEDKAAFISYLKYTNSQVIKILDSLLQDTQRQPLIIVQSDHSYRDFRKDQVGPAQYFRNYSAFYFPDRDYSSIYDSVSNINTFPLLFNKYFNTHIPLQKDSVVFLAY